MGTNAGNILTLANSIIGVSVLAMPFCFKQCGIVLSILMLLFSSVISRLACHFLIKSALLEKRKNFEMLAFRVYGPTGKLMVELCIIGFMLGTCVAFFVIMGDLGPAILGPPLGFEHPSALRPSVLIGVAVFVVLPLGLLRNVDSLNAICAASILFYVCLVFKVLSEAAGNIIEWNWLDKVYLWRPSGILQCIPIFSMALSCQTQLFEIFDGLLNTPLDRMNGVVRTAINMTTMFYISVGLFGYIAYCNQTFTGNVMMNFSPTLWSEVIKIGFVLSVAVSFPLVIFPCRASIHSLLFSKSGHGYELVGGSSHIPETRFQCITLVIVTSSLVVGLVMPSIEVVLGLIGSTIGVFICVITPAVIFTSLSTKNTNERIVAQMVVGIGLIIMVLGTYANLSATQEAMREKRLPDIRQEIKIKPPIVQAAVTDIPVKAPTNFIVDSKSKDIGLESKKSNLPEEPQVMNKPLIISKEELSKKVPLPDSVPNVDSLIKEDVKKGGSSFESEALKKLDSLIEANKNAKIEKDNAPPVANPEPPPQEIPKAVPAVLPVAPLVLSPEIIKDSKPKDVKDNNLAPPLPPLQSVIRKEPPLPLNSSSNSNVQDSGKNTDAKLPTGGEVVKQLPQLEQQLPEKFASNKQVIAEKSDKVDMKPSEQLAMSMAQGVPLPLAVKGIIPNEEKKIKQSGNIPSGKEKKNSPAERGLLEKIEPREKRDTEIEEKRERKQVKENEQPVEETKTTEKVIATVKPEQESLNTDEENCPRTTESSNSIKEEPIVANPSEQSRQLQESLIKIPARLTEPEAKLDADPKLLADSQLQENNVMPKKRDLKSVDRKDDK